VDGDFEAVHLETVGPIDCIHRGFVCLEMNEGIGLARADPILREIDAVNGPVRLEDLAELGFRPIAGNVGYPDRLRDVHPKLTVDEQQNRDAALVRNVNARSVNMGKA
jgi:hypothetical protein